MTRKEKSPKEAPQGPDRGRHSKARGLLWCVVAYVAALAAAFGAGFFVRDRNPLLVVLVADLVGTAVVFAFSVAFNNSSLYDPYWSVAPLPIAAYWLWIAPSGVPLPRQVLLTAMLALWGGRLTYSWARGWPGLHHEDWRYVDIRKATGRAYWPASFAAIHLLPTAFVYAGCLALYPALASPGRSFGALDGVATAVCLVAVWFEATADKQLHEFVATRTDPKALLDTGLWAYSRHPNYFGEVLFWWGVYLFGVAARPELWWIVVGPASMTFLFFFISIPLIDKRMLRRRPHYRQHMKRVSRLVPWFPAKTPPLDSPE